MSHYQELSKYFTILYHTNNVISDTGYFFHKPDGIYKIVPKYNYETPYIRKPTIDVQKISLYEPHTLTPISPDVQIIGINELTYADPEYKKMWFKNDYDSSKLFVTCFNNQKRICETYGLRPIEYIKSDYDYYIYKCLPKNIKVKPYPYLSSDIRHKNGDWDICVSVSEDKLLINCCTNSNTCDLITINYCYCCNILQCPGCYYDTPPHSIIRIDDEIYVLATNYRDKHGEYTVNVWKP